MRCRPLSLWSLWCWKKKRSDACSCGMQQLNNQPKSRVDNLLLPSRKRRTVTNPLVAHFSPLVSMEKESIPIGDKVELFSLLFCILFLKNGFQSVFPYISDQMLQVDNCWCLSLFIGIDLRRYSLAGKNSESVRTNGIKNRPTLTFLVIPKLSLSLS